MKTSFSRQAILFSMMALLLSGALACKKDNPTPLEQLPPETQEGKNTFGCLVNGNAWKSGIKDCYLFCPSTLDIDYWKGNFRIHAKKLDGENKEYISIKVDSVVYSPGIYPLANNTESHGSFEIQNGCFYETDNVNTGTLEITRLDTLNFIISGRFSFRVTKPGCETVNITDGRFDVKYYF